MWQGENVETRSEVGEMEKGKEKGREKAGRKTGDEERRFQGEWEGGDREESVPHTGERVSTDLADSAPRDDSTDLFLTCRR